jgi:hypothetical protein
MLGWRTILMICSSRFCEVSANGHKQECMYMTNLEALVLENPLDGGIFATGGHLCLEHNTEGAISDYLALSVLHLLGLPRESILDFFSYDFCCRRTHINYQKSKKRGGKHIPPIRKPENTPGRFWDITEASTRL